MEDTIELNSNNCFDDKLELQLQSFAASYIADHSSGLVVLAVKMIEGGEIGMKVSHFGHNSYGLSFYSGYLRFIYDGLYLILSDNCAFSKIGNSSNTMKMPSLKYDVPVNYFEFKVDLFAGEKARFDRERYNLHLFLYKITTTLIVLHECQHILSGHTGFYAANKIKGAEDAVDRGLLTLLDLQTLEMDADSNSIFTLLNIVKSNTEYFNIPKTLKNEESILSSIVFVSYFLFFIIPGKSYKTIEEIRLLTHPSNGFRFGIMIDTLSTSFLNNSQKNLSDALSKIIVTVITDFKKVISNITNESIDTADLKLFYTNEGKKYIDEMLLNWNYLRPKLEPFALKKLAPYTLEYTKEKFEYNQFVTRLNEFKLSWLALMYSNVLLVNHLKNNVNCSASVGEVSIKGSMADDEVLKISTKIITEQISSYATFRNEEFSKTADALWAINAQHLRSKVLQETFETINYFFKNTEHLEKLHSYDWFRVLYVLSDNSLFNSRFKDVHFPKSIWKPRHIPSIEWNGVKIYNGQLSRDIRYTDKQIFDLLEFVIYFFDNNQKDFT